MPFRSPLPSRPSLPDRQYLSHRFAGQSLTRKFLAWLALDVQSMRKLEAHVLRGEDAVVMAFRSGRVGGLGWLAVTSALLTALTSSTLKTTYLSLSTGPIARAMIATALLLSLLATILAVILQQVLTALSSPESMRMWLSNGDATSSPHSKPQRELATLDSNPDPNLTLKISVASLLLLRLPNTLLCSASTLYALGLGSFLALAWILPAQSSPAHPTSAAPTLLFTLMTAPSLLGTAALLRRKMRETHRAERAGRRVASAQARARAAGDRGRRGGDIEAPPTRSVDEVNEIEAAMAREKGGKEALPKRERESQQPEFAFTIDEVAYHDDVAGALEEAAKAHRDLAELIRDAMGEEQ